MSSSEKISSIPNPEQSSIKQRNLGYKIRKIAGSFFHKEEPTKAYLLSEQLPKDKSFKKMYEALDKDGITMPLEMGILLESYMNNPDIWFGVHHSDAVDGEAFENDTVLQTIMQEGLLNSNNDARMGFVTHEASRVGDTVRHCDGMFKAVAHIKSNRDGSDGAVLVAIPKKYFEGDLGRKTEYDDGNIKSECRDSVYDHKADGRTLIKPEFLVGFVQNLGEGHTLQFKTRDEIIAAANKNQQQ